MKREPDDSEEVLRLFDEYEKEAAFLLARIKMRDEDAALLKIAKPSKIAALRDLISRFDSVIEQTEKILSNIVESIEMQRKADENYRELDAVMKSLPPELLQFIADGNQNDSEK